MVKMANFILYVFYHNLKHWRGSGEKLLMAEQYLPCTRHNGGMTGGGTGVFKPHEVIIFTFT